MQINPSTNIRLLKDVPLDSTYDHTIYFASASAQATYFQSLTKYNLTDYTYQRVNKGVARVGIKADSLYDCNYMMFQNTAFGTKWFYAFITSVEYVNNECSEIHFEIDVMQTWHFEYSTNQCFVEREHSVTDVIGEHIEPEGIEIGEHVFNDYQLLLPSDVGLSSMSVIIVVSDTDASPDGNVYNGIYSGATMYAYLASDKDGINTKLKEYVQKPDAIVAMYMCPTSALPGLPPTGGSIISQSDTCVTHDVTLNKLQGTEDIDGIVPKNKKLYTYPYNYLMVTAGTGKSMVERYEFFDARTPKFRCYYGMTMPVQVMLQPLNYKGVTANTNSESVTISDFPLCSWSTDAYKAWVAQNSLPMFSNIVTSVAGATASGAVMGGFIGGAMGLATGTISSVTKALGDMYSASIQADPIKGSTNSGSLNIARKQQTFYYGRMSVNKCYAKMIDEYFTMYGYKTNRLKVPNRSSRPHWNYVKTVGCTLTGSVPADDMKKLCQIYDHGVTFWKKGSEVGNYALDNSPE